MKRIRQNASLLIGLTFITLLILAIFTMPAIQAQQDGAAQTSAGAMASDPVVGLPPDSPWRPDAQPTDLVEVIVELEDPPAVEIYAQARENAAARAVEPTVAAQAQLARIEQAQQTLVNELAGSRIRAAVTGRLQRVYNGIAVQVEAGKLDEIRALPGVKAVHPDGVLYPGANNAVPFIGAPTAWTTGMGVRGEGIKIGIIDTGIDYLHRNFGGPGTGYESNNTTIIGDAPGFPGVKVAGGYDFVGDDYDPESEDPAKRISRPDPDPMDCSGHGTAVASIATGQGVNTDGSTYTGPYDTTTPFVSLEIGPGVAPKAILYGLKVFGCGGRHPFRGGSTSFSVVAQAVEWSVDPNGDGDFTDRLDVINLSLGRRFQVPDDPSVVAINNAVLAGVIAAVSAGNGGDSYYTRGGPSLAGRAISAAASVDTGIIYLGLRINSPANLAGQIEAAPVIIGPPMSATPITANLAAPEPANACTALTNAAAMNGRIALINGGGCSDTVKVRNAQNAGAVADHAPAARCSAAQYH